APVPAAMRSPIANAISGDIDPGVALAAAAVLCFDLAVDQPAPILDALGPAGISRIRALVAGSGPKAQLRDARRCLAAADRQPR
nr:hypothetical protein [Myxococcota bacterium]